MTIENVCDARVKVLDGGYGRKCQDQKQPGYYDIE